MIKRCLYQILCGVWFCFATGTFANANGFLCESSDAIYTVPVNGHRGNTEDRFEAKRQLVQSPCNSTSLVGTESLLQSVDKPADDIVQNLLNWIETHSLYSVDTVAIPEVEIMTSHEITDKFYKGNLVSKPDGGADDRILAFYDAAAGANGAIYLRMDTLESQSYSAHTEKYSEPLQKLIALKKDLAIRTVKAKAQLYIFKNNPILTERLIHELVHHVQHQTGAMKSFPCVARGEKEAYRLGGLYYNQLQIDDPMPNRNFWADLYSLC